jgi:hypothetical protein
MEESVPGKSSQLQFSLWGMKVTASGGVSFIVGAAVAALIVAVAWRLVS